MPIGKKKKGDSGDGLEVNIAPLIDVVFLLIIFFMSIWQAAHIEVAAKLTLPVASQGNPELPQDTDRLIINVDKDGAIYVSNLRMSKDELGKMLANERAKSADAEGFAKRPVYIRADENLPFGDVQEIMRVCLNHRVWKLSLRTIKPKENM